MAKTLIPIPPFGSWNDARNALSVAIQSIITWVQSLPPKTDMQNNRVVNVANPVNPQDAVTLGFLNTRLGGSGAQGTSSALNPAIGSGTVAWKVGVSPWAKIAATNGQLNISAGGTNQSIILSPSGAGGVMVAGLGESSNTSAMLQVNGLIRATDYNTPTTGTGVDIFYAPLASPWGGVRCYDYTLAAYKELDVDGSPLILNAYSGKSVGVGTSPPNAAYKLEFASPAWPHLMA